MLGKQSNRTTRPGAQLCRVPALPVGPCAPVQRVGYLRSTAELICSAPRIFSNSAGRVVGAWSSRRGPIECQRHSAARRACKLIDWQGVACRGGPWTPRGECLARAPRRHGSKVLRRRAGSNPALAKSVSSICSSWGRSYAARRLSSGGPCLAGVSYAPRGKAALLAGAANGFESRTGSAWCSESSRPGTRLGDESEASACRGACGRETLAASASR